MRSNVTHGFAPVLLLVVCAYATACLASQPSIPARLPTSPSRPSPTSIPVVMPTRLMAALSGRIVRVDGCFRVDTEQGSDLIGWTPVFEVHLEQDAIAIRDTLTGEQAQWRVGDWIQIGGGYPSQMDPESRPGQPDGCPGPYFVMHAF